MKHIIFLFLVCCQVAGQAQPRLVTQAIITTKTTITAPEGDEAPPPPPPGPGMEGAEVRIVRFGGEGETRSTTWLKNDLTKTLSESDMGQTTVIRDNSKKITTTIMAIMGRKSGFYATDAEQAEMRRRLDSMMATRNRGGSNNLNATPPTYSFVYLEDSKKIAGFVCRKAVMITSRSNGSADSMVVWYVPDLKLQNLASTGGVAAGPGAFAITGGSDGLAALNGFPMEYERTMRGGRKMTVQVTKLVIDKEVADKEFEIPRDIDIKAMKDMQNGGPNIQFRMGG